MSATKTQVDQLSQDFIGGKKPPETPVLNQPVERDEQSRIQKLFCRIQKLFCRIPKLIHGSERCSLGFVQCCFSPFVRVACKVTGMMSNSQQHHAHLGRGQW